MNEHADKLQQSAFLQIQFIFVIIQLSGNKKSHYRNICLRNSLLKLLQNSL